MCSILYSAQSKVKADGVYLLSDGRDLDTPSYQEDVVDESSLATTSGQCTQIGGACTSDGNCKEPDLGVTRHGRRRGRVQLGVRLAVGRLKPRLELRVRAKGFKRQGKSG